MSSTTVSVIAAVVLVAWPFNGSNVGSTPASSQARNRLRPSLANLAGLERAPRIRAPPEDAGLEAPAVRTTPMPYRP
jgi:hypothetical protein